MNELIHPALPLALNRDGGKGCEFALDAETGTLTLIGEARSDLFIDPSDSSLDRPEAGYVLGVPPQGDFTLSAQVTVRQLSDTGDWARPNGGPKALRMVVQAFRRNLTPRS